MDDFDTQVQCEEVYGFDEAEAMREVRAAELEEQIRAARRARSRCCIARWSMSVDGSVILAGCCSSPSPGPLPGP